MAKPVRPELDHLPVGRRQCPICGKPAASGHGPFCSARCANIDLGRWLKGNYRVETDEPPEDGNSDGDGDGQP